MTSLRSGQVVNNTDIFHFSLGELYSFALLVKRATAMNVDDDE